MSKSVKISDAHHEQANIKADKYGMKLYRLVEIAIETYEPNLQAASTPRDQHHRRRTKRIAG